MSLLIFKPSRSAIKCMHQFKMVPTANNMRELYSHGKENEPHTSASIYIYIFFKALIKYESMTSYIHQDIK